MDKNRIGINQLALLYLLSIAGGKFLTLPSILAKDVGTTVGWFYCSAFCGMRYVWCFCCLPCV